MPRRPSQRPRNIQCSQCTRQFSSNQGLSQHTNKVHEGNMAQQEANRYSLPDMDCVSPLSTILCQQTIRHWAWRPSVPPYIQFISFQPEVSCFWGSWGTWGTFCSEVPLYNVMWRYMMLHDVTWHILNRKLPGESFSDALYASYAMATDASKWDVNMFIRMCADSRFKPQDITFKSANDLLEAVSSVVKVVCNFITSHNVICCYMISCNRGSNQRNLVSEIKVCGKDALSSWWLICCKTLTTRIQSTGQASHHLHQGPIPL